MPVKPMEEQGIPAATPRRSPKHDGVYLIFLGACVILLLSLSLVIHPSSSTAKDFRVVYFPARTLLAGFDPYNADHVIQTVNRAGENASIAEPVDREIQGRYVYPPTAFAVTLPFAVLPWRAASILWMLASTFGLILSGLLAWDLSRDLAPTASAILIAWVLANSEVVVVLSNPSALAISLAVVGSWCLLKNRFAWVGVILFSLSLCLKPQDAAPIWCFFLLTSPGLRKRALQIAVMTAVIALPGLLWVWHSSPHWSSELHSNLSALSAPGGPADPGPLDPDSELVDFQVVFSRIKDVPAFYNLLSYLAGVPLLILWGYLALRSRRSIDSQVLSLAAVVPLSLLPVYHHFYDTKLLLLCIPGFALLWARGRRTRWGALAFTLVALIVTADLPHTVLNRNHLGGLAKPYFPSLPVLLAPISLLAMGLFYLWAFWKISVLPARVGEGSSQV